MNKIILTIAFVLAATIQSFAHYLWIETNATGIINQEQEIRVYFGEFTYGVIETVGNEAFEKVKNFTVWVVDANGNKSELTVVAKENYYLAKYTPSTNGTYTVLLNNNKIDVADYTKYDFGIIKTHYHAVTKFQVGEDFSENIVSSNEDGITLKDIYTDKNEVKLQVLYKNKVLSEYEVTVFMKDQWKKKLTTDKEGIVSFKRLFETKYIVEVTNKEEVFGVYKGVKYEAIWHCVTYCIK